jgi:uncharacterized membrane protein
MPLFFTSLIFVLSLISLSLGFKALVRAKQNADVCAKLHVLLVQIIIVLSVITILMSGFGTLRCLIRGPYMMSQGSDMLQKAPPIARRR